MLGEGSYKGKIATYGILSGEKNTDGTIKMPQVFVKFSIIEETGQSHHVTWFGGFKELQPGKEYSQREFTIRALLTMGFAGNSIADLWNGLESKQLDTEKVLDLKIEFQKDAMGTIKCDARGEPNFQVSGIYDPENSGFKNQISDFATAKKQMDFLKVDGELMAIKAKQPAKAVKQAPAPVENPFAPATQKAAPVATQAPIQNGFSTDDIPF